MDKTQFHKDLRKKMKISHNKRYFLESTWIQYAIIEDRLNSVIRHTYPKKGIELLQTLRGLDNKINHIIDKVHNSNNNCRKIINKLLLKQIKNWKKKRNDLMHEIIKSQNIQKLLKDSEQLSLQGLELVDKLSTKVWSYKAKLKK